MKKKFVKIKLETKIRSLVFALLITPHFSHKQHVNL